MSLFTSHPVHSSSRRRSAAPCWLPPSGRMQVAPEGPAFGAVDPDRGLRRGGGVAFVWPSRPPAGSSRWRTSSASSPSTGTYHAPGASTHREWCSRPRCARRPAPDVGRRSACRSRGFLAHPNSWRWPGRRFTTRPSSGDSLSTAIEFLRGTSPTCRSSPERRDRRPILTSPRGRRSPQRWPP